MADFVHFRPKLSQIISYDFLYMINQYHTVLKNRVNPKNNAPMVLKPPLEAYRDFELILKLFSKSVDVRPSNSIFTTFLLNNKLDF